MYPSIQVSSAGTPLALIYGDSDGLATVTVLRIVTFGGDLVYVLGDLEVALSAGERLLVCMVVGELVFAENRSVGGEDPPPVGIALW